MIQLIPIVSGSKTKRYKHQKIKKLTANFFFWFKWIAYGLNEIWVVFDQLGLELSSWSVLTNKFDNYKII